MEHSGSRKPRGTKSGGSPPSAWSPSTPSRLREPLPTASRQGRTALYGLLNFSVIRSVGSPRPGRSRSTRFRPRQPSPMASWPGLTARCGLPRSLAAKSGGSPHPGHSPSTQSKALPTTLRRGRTAHCGLRRAVTAAQSTSGGSRRLGRLLSTPTRCSMARLRSQPGLMARCGSLAPPGASAGSPQPGQLPNMAPIR